MKDTNHFKIQPNADNPLVMEEGVKRLSKIYELSGGDKNNINIAVCGGHQHEDIFKQFKAKNPDVSVEYTSSDADYKVFEDARQTVFFVNCQSDFIQRFYIIKDIPQTVVVFLIDDDKQLKELFNRGETMRYHVTWFLPPAEPFEDLPK
jgi:hypothetical protein